MNRSKYLVVLCAGLGATGLGIPALSQQDTQAPGLERARPHLSRSLPGQEGFDEQRRFDREAWREALADPDLDQRERSFEDLVARAASSEEVVAVLREWAADPGDPDLAWTSRLALRELEAGPNKRLRRRGRAQSFFDALDPWSSQSLGGDPFQDLESRLQQMLGPGTGGRIFQMSPNGQLRSHTFRMESGPGGVRIEIGNDDGQGDDTRTYEAESLEELFENNPELEGEIGTLQPGRLDSEAMLEGLQAPFDIDRFWNRRSPSLRTDILGVLMREPSPDTSVAPGLEPGVGLVIERTVPDTIASALGLRRGDIVTAINDRPMRSGDDVSSVLAARDANEPLTVVIDRDGQRRTLTWNPSPAPR